MDITVTIPDAKAQAVLDALNATPTHDWTPVTSGTAAQKRAAVTAYLQTRWKDELRALVVQHRRGQAIQAAVEADRALPDPLA